MAFEEPFHYSLYAPELYILFIMITVLGYYFRKPYLYVLSFLLLLIILVFYRKNTSPIDARENVIVYPCEGRILKVLRDEKHLTIVIFLNVNNVHIQYFPYKGKIYEQTHKEGEFYPAYMFEKTDFNERVETTLATKYGHIQVYQIAGLVARRIVSFHNKGDSVNKGDPMGLIKFGSQVRVKIPLENIKEVYAKENEYVQIGEAICEMKY